ncbi:hypothetical protein L484_015714 [Morus notabilis]|uniref:Uncharacterized protein n=1 Tax=Morus notabilis TaxID=981085 RepID=W9SB07_9ROSA|nr:hypothetical protein L484_015714 [Morus notabilis]
MRPNSILVDGDGDEAFRDEFLGMEGQATCSVAADGRCGELLPQRSMSASEE